MIYIVLQTNKRADMSRGPIIRGAWSDYVLAEKALAIFDAEDKRIVKEIKARYGGHPRRAHYTVVGLVENTPLPRKNDDNG